MKKIRSIFSFVAIISMLFGAIPFAPAQAALTDWQRGASIQPFSTTDIGSADAKRALDSLKSTGANYVTLIIPYYQNNRQSTAMYPSWNTPTDEALITAIDYAHSIGLRVMLKPHLETDYIEWRGNIDPAPQDRPAWFESYGRMLEHYGRIAQAHNVEDFCIGTELLRMANPQYHSDNTTEWKKLIARTRAVYSGKVTYSANWYGELEYNEFWGDLDYIGVSAYYDLYHASNNSVAELEKSWDGWRNGVLEPMQKKYNKPIVFTELGYRSIHGAYRDPWDWSRDAAYSEVDQANSYAALFDYWNKYPWMKGVQLWRWAIYPPGANSGDKDYVPQNKQAESVMKQYWGGLTTTQPQPLPNPNPNPQPNPTTTPPTNQPPADSTPVQNTSWSASGSMANTPTVGSNLSITAVIKNQSSVAVPNTVVDFEIYNGSGQQVFQRFYEGQSFSANQQKSYSVNWTPTSNGNYTFKIGVFNPSWTYNYYWADAAVPIGVGTGSTSSTPPPPPPQGTTTTTTPPPTSTETSLEIWWPGNGVTVSGVQPFKAMLTNRDVGNYKMFWQVDGDRLNEMGNSAADYPHKESLVDLTGWNWKQTGPYEINFVAKDFNGTVIKQKAVNINIVQ